MILPGISDTSPQITGTGSEMISTLRNRDDYAVRAPGRRPRMSRTYSAPRMAAGAGGTRSETAETFMVEIDTTTGTHGFDHARGAPVGAVADRVDHVPGLMGILRRRARWLGLRLRFTR